MPKRLIPGRPQKCWCGRVGPSVHRCVWPRVGPKRADAFGRALARKCWRACPLVGLKRADAVCRVGPKSSGAIGCGFCPKSVLRRPKEGARRMRHMRPTLELLGCRACIFYVLPSVRAEVKNSAKVVALLIAPDEARQPPSGRRVFQSQIWKIVRFSSLRLLAIGHWKACLDEEVAPVRRLASRRLAEAGLEEGGLEEAVLKRRLSSKGGLPPGGWSWRP